MILKSTINNHFLLSISIKILEGPKKVNTNGISPLLSSMCVKSNKIEYTHTGMTLLLISYE